MPFVRGMCALDWRPIDFAIEEGLIRSVYPRGARVPGMTAVPNDCWCCAERAGWPPDAAPAVVDRGPEVTVHWVVG